MNTNDGDFLESAMQELTTAEIADVSGGGIGNEAAYGAAIGVSGGLLTLGLTVTAPVWGTALLLGGAIGASLLAISYACE